MCTMAAVVAPKGCARRRKHARHVGHLVSADAVISRCVVERGVVEGAARREDGNRRGGLGRSGDWVSCTVCRPDCGLARRELARDRLRAVFKVTSTQKFRGRRPHGCAAELHAGWNLDGQPLERDPESSGRQDCQIPSPHTKYSTVQYIHTLALTCTYIYTYTIIYGLPEPEDEVRVAPTPPRHGD